MDDWESDKRECQQLIAKLPGGSLRSLGGGWMQAVWMSRRGQIVSMKHHGWNLMLRTLRKMTRSPEQGKRP
jgi:hypothetical protein